MRAVGTPNHRDFLEQAQSAQTIICVSNEVGSYHPGNATRRVFRRFPGRVNQICRGSRRGLSVGRRITLAGAKTVV
jgi:adenosyl cobinamide kinase/adenosyl cobinamide phosphate guanylyltransferase